MEFSIIALVALLFLAYSLFSSRIASFPVTAPMIFTAAGVCVGLAFPQFLGGEMEKNEYVHLLAEFTLIFVLFTDAAAVNFRELKKNWNLPFRMLVIALPLTIVVATATGYLFFGSLLGFSGCLLLAAILAPTDAALGQSIVANESVPLKIRQAISVESGLNDGICLPLVVIIAAAAALDTNSGELLEFAFSQVVFGPLVGIAVGFVGAKLIDFAVGHSFIAKAFEGIAALAIAVVAFSLAELVHGNGFISVFVGGLVFGSTLRNKCEFLYEFAESEGQFFTLSTFFVFGIIACALVDQHFTWVYLVYGALSLTLIRMIPIALSLLGTDTDLFSKSILGWFGPRGLASILFALLIIEKEEIVNKDLIIAIVITTVLMSVFLHGVSANPLAQMYKKK